MTYRIEIKNEAGEWEGIENFETYKTEAEAEKDLEELKAVNAEFQGRFNEIDNGIYRITEDA